MLWLVILGCADEPVVGLPEGPPMEDVELTLGSGPEATRITLAGAWPEADGTGRGVGAKATVPGPPPLVVTGERSTWDLSAGRVVFEGDVQAVRAEVTLYAARIEVAYAGDKVEQAWASGGVRVVRGGREATGETAHLAVAEGRVALEGAPTVTYGPNRMTGDRIVLFLDDDRLECEKCRLEVAGAAVAPK